MYKCQGGVASPWLFSWRCVEIWSDSARMGLDLASLSRVTASRSEACACNNVRLRAREGTARATTTRPCERMSQAEAGRFEVPRGGASKLGMGHRLLGPGESLLLALLQRQARRRRARQAKPLQACVAHPCQGIPQTHCQSLALWLGKQ